MAIAYSSVFQPKRIIPQSEPLTSQQKPNNGGGFAWRVDKWQLLNRFLILGSEGGTYYVNQKDLTKENALNVIECIKENGLKALDTIRRISGEGVAPKNEPALFALALAMTYGDGPTKERAYQMITGVARIGTHLFTLCQYIQDLRGWSRGLRKGVSKWYTDMSVEQLEYQLLKYRQRNGWTHKDVLRLAHPKTASEQKNELFKVTTKGWYIESPVSPRVAFVLGNTSLMSPPVLAAAIKDLKLTREMLPTEALRHKEVWQALLSDMPLHALLRNLGKLSSIEILTNMNDETHEVAKKFRDKEYIKKSRLHPITILNALRVYSSGKGEKGSLTWQPSTAITQALNDAFYLAFDNVEPTNKRILLALDVSGSMDWHNIAGTGLTPRQASAALAMVSSAVEPKHEIVAFCDNLLSITIPQKAPLESVLQDISRLNFGSTNCALPMLYALDRKIPVDAFLVYTDSETNCGHIHPKAALDLYRERMGIDAKLVVVAMTATNVSIADPNDKGMLDVVGFDTGVPALISEFIR